MAGEDLSVIISVFLEDQASAALAELPAQVQKTAQQINAILQEGLGAGGIARFREDLAAGTLSADQLRAAIAALGEASARSFDVRGIASVTLQLDELQAAAIEARAALGGSGASFNDVLLGGGGNTVAQLEEQLARLNAAKAAASDSAALASVNAGTGSLAVLEKYSIDSKATADYVLASEQRKLVVLQQELALVEEAKATAETGTFNDTRLTAARAAVDAQRQVVADIRSATREFNTASTGLPVPGASAALSGSILGADNPRIALLEQELALRQRILTDANALNASEQETLSLTRAVVTSQEQLANAIKRQATEQATAAGGNGGFFGGLGQGLVGGNGDATDPFNLGRQLGDIARYIYVYEAFYKITAAIKDSINLTKEYENGLISLGVALGSVSQQGAVTGQQLASVGAAAGFTPGESLNVASRGIQAFHDESSQSAAQAQAVALETVDAAQQGVVLSGQKVAEVQDQVIATTRAYELGAAGQARVLDAATNANINFGASIKDVLDGLAQVAGIGKESGFTVEQLANTIGLITSTTGLSGSSAAGDLKRILGGAGAPAFQKALEQVGVDTTNQTVEQQLTSLAAKYQSLTQAQQENVLTTLGGRRSAESLIPLLESSGRFAEANAFSLANAGAAADQYAKRQDTLAGILRQVGGVSKELLVDLGTSGVGAGFGLVLDALLPLLKALDEGVKLFEIIPAPIREIGFALLELAAAIRVVEAANLGALLSKIPLLGLGGGAAAAEGEQLALFGATARPGIFGALRGVGSAGVATLAGTAEEGALGSSIGALGAAAGPAAAAIGVLTLAIGANHALDLADSLGKVNGQIDAINANISSAKGPEDLRTQAIAAASDAAKIKAQTDGFFGTLGVGINALFGNDPTVKANQLVDLANQLSQQATTLENIQAAQPNSGVFGTGGPQSVSQLDAKVKDLTASGHTAAEIVQDLAAALTQLGIAGKQALTPTGANVGLLGGAGFAITAADLNPDLGAGFTSTGVTGLSAADIRAQQAANPGAAVSGAATTITSVSPSVDERQRLQDDVTAYLSEQNKSQPGAKLSDQDLNHIADLYASDVLKNFPPDIVPKIRAAYLAKLQDAASHGGTVAPDVSIVDDVVTNLLKNQQTALSDANARGANSDEIAQIQKRTVAQLEAARGTYAAIGAAIPDDLNQKILVAGRGAYDAFAKHITELAGIAKTEAGSNQALKSQIDQQTVALLQTGQSLDPSLLPTGFINLGQAKLFLAKAVLAGSAADRVAAAAFDAAQKEAAALIAAAQANLDAAVAQFTSGAGNENDNALIHASNRLAQTTVTAAGIAASVPKPGSFTNDPSYQATIDALKASGTASASAGDTAAQIAAAANAANVFPGAKVEEAAAAIQTAAANLAKEKGGTVAYFNALGALRKAQYDYTTAVLEAQNVSRELLIDLTNPLAVAENTLLTARDKLASDRSKGAPADVLNADRLAVQQAANAEQNTKFTQNLDQVKTNYDLERITQTQYLAYLDAQHNHLLAIHNRTFQQQQELNDIDKLLQEAAKQLQGQFNLGSIKLPTPFEVRRALAGGASASAGNVQYVSIQIDGADTGKVTQIMATYLGTGAYLRATTTTAKV